MKLYGWVTIDGEPQKIHIKTYQPQMGPVTDDLGRALVPKEEGFLIWPGEHDPKRYSAWREIWQSYSPERYLEIDFQDDDRNYTADMIDRIGYIVEFQPSPVTLEEIAVRERVYQKMYWLIDATEADWIRLTSVVDETMVRPISYELALVKERKPWWSYFSKAIFLDLGIGVGCIEGTHYSISKVKYYLCRICSYDYFIQSLFHIKKDFELNPLHQTDTSVQSHRLQELKYAVTIQGESFWVECTSNWTYQHREALNEFGMKLGKRYTFRLFPSKERAQHEEEIEECRRLLESMKLSIELEHEQRLKELEEIKIQLDRLSDL